VTAGEDASTPEPSASSTSKVAIVTP
jgi:hypothetical protein